MHSRAIDFVRNGSETYPRDKLIHDAAQEFCQQEFGNVYDFSLLARAWAVLDEDSKVTAVGGLVNIVDCPIFHVGKPDSRQGLIKAIQSRDLLFARLHGNLEDAGLSGARVLINVESQAEKMWANYLKRLKAEPAHRYMLEI